MSTPTDGPLDPFGDGLPLSLRFRRDLDALPEALGGMARFVVDNPRQVAITIAAAIVLDEIAINLVKPRTPVQALALMIVMPVVSGWLLAEAMKRGILQFNVRDENGCLVPWEPPKE